MNVLNSHKKIIRIGFIGAGSIGSLFGGLLASIKQDRNSFEMVFFCREEHCREINKGGLLIQKPGKIINVRNIIAYENLKHVEKIIIKDPNYHYKFLFISTKTPDLEKSLIQYKNIIDSSSWVVILQNGIGNREIVSQFCEKKKL